MLCLLWDGDCLAVSEVARLDFMRAMRESDELARGGTEESATGEAKAMQIIGEASDCESRLHE
jgi:hypothetical protein